MKNFIKFFTVFILVFLATNLYAQDYIKVKRLDVTQNLELPYDTILAPKRVGEIRFRLQDGLNYQCISLTAPKKWEVLGGTWVFQNGAEAANIRNILRFPNDSTILARSIGVLATGGLVSTVDSNGTQITWTISLPSQTGHSGKALVTDGTNASWQTVSGGGGVSAVTSIGTGNSNGMTISGTNINLHKVTLTTPGILTNGSDSISGDKYWNGRHTFHDFDIHSTRAAADNFYRGFRMFKADGGDVGGLLYNEALNRIAIGEFSSLGTTLDIYANGNAAISISPSNVVTLGGLSGTGNRLATVSSTGALSSAITYIKHQENADFGVISAQNSSTITMSVPGSLVSDQVLVQSSQNPAGIFFTARISSNGTLSLTAHNYSPSAIDPDNSTFTFIIYR